MKLHYLKFDTITNPDYLSEPSYSMNENKNGLPHLTEYPEIITKNNIF